MSEEKPDILTAKYDLDLAKYNLAVAEQVLSKAEAQFHENIILRSYELEPGLVDFLKSYENVSPGYGWKVERSRVCIKLEVWANTELTELIRIVRHKYLKGVDITDEERQYRQKSFDELNQRAFLMNHH